MILGNVSKILKLPVILITLSVLMLGFICSSTLGHKSMHMNSMEALAVTMPVDNQQKCCTMTDSKKFEQFQNLLLVLPKETQGGFALLLLGLALALAFFVSWPKFSWDADNHFAPAYRFYARDNPEFALFNQLRLAFAQGILSPKVF